jgi:hypothetical protein
LLQSTSSNLVEAITFSKKGAILVVEGKGSKGNEGADLCSQENVAIHCRSKLPAFSKQFLLIEAYNGTAPAYPVFSWQGEFIEGISAIIEPNKLLNALVAPQLQLKYLNSEQHYRLWCPGYGAGKDIIDLFSYISRILISLGQECFIYCPN